MKYIILFNALIFLFFIIFTFFFICDFLIPKYSKSELKNGRTFV